MLKIDRKKLLQSLFGLISSSCLISVIHFFTSCSKEKSECDRISIKNIPLALDKNFLDMIQNDYIHHNSMQNIVQLYLKKFPKEKNIQCIMLKIFPLDCQKNLYKYKKNIKKEIQSKIRLDFKNKKTLLIDKWLFSITELRIASLKYLIRSN